MPPRSARLALEPLEDRSLPAAGRLDPSFGLGGKVLTDFSGPLPATAEVIARQSDGRLVTAGEVGNPQQTDLILARFTVAGTLDNSFGTGGRVYARFAGPSTAAGVSVLADGRILVAGSVTDFLPLPDGTVRRSTGGVLLRFRPDGTADPTFGQAGVLRLNSGPARLDGISGLAVQPDGRLLVIGAVGAKVVRLNANGGLDAGFGTGGFATTTLPGKGLMATGITLAADGRLVVACTSITGAAQTPGVVILRYSPDGKPDGSFGNKGVADLSAGGGYAFDSGPVVVQSDGRIVESVFGDNFSGRFYAALRLNTDGAVDQGFGSKGITAGTIVGGTGGVAVAIQPDGKILEVCDAKLLRYNADGSPDTSFAGNGTTALRFGADTGHGRCVGLAQDGTIVVAGFAGDPDLRTPVGLARLAGDGSIDPSFGQGGSVVTGFTGPVGSPERFDSLVVTAPEAPSHSAYLVLQPDGKILAATTASVTDAGDFALARLNADGTPDRGFGQGGKVSTDLGGAETLTAVALQGDGKIVVAGASARSSEDGSLLFGYSYALARYNPDGSLDAAFGSGGKVVGGADGGAEAAFHAAALLPDGKILAVGTYGPTGFGDAAAEILLARFNPNGTLDRQVLTPVANLGVVATSVVVLPGGRIVVGGGSDDGQNAVLARYLQDLSADTNFGKTGQLVFHVGIGGFIRNLALRPDGRIAGLASDGGTQLKLVGFNIDGTFDTTFGSGGRTVTPLKPSDFKSGLALQPDGRIVVSGMAPAPGTSDDHLTVARYLPGGSPDNTFGAGGVVRTDLGARLRGSSDSILDWASDVAVTADGKVLAAGYTSSWHNGQTAVLRYLGAGTAERYVANLYQDLLGRSADPGGLAAWTAALSAGMPRTAVAAALINTDEFRAQRVRESYQMLLHRAADAQGIAAFTAQLRGGGTAQGMRALLAGSDEYYQNRGGGTINGFLNAVYVDLLGRPMDAGARDAFARAMAAGLSRTAVAYAVATSREAYFVLVGSFYTRYLRRAADAGMAGLVDALLRGARDEAVIALFVSSDEYLARA